MKAYQGYEKKKEICTSDRLLNKAEATEKSNMLCMIKYAINLGVGVSNNIWVLIMTLYREEK